MVTFYSLGPKCSIMFNEPGYVIFSVLCQCELQCICHFIPESVMTQPNVRKIMSPDKDVMSSANFTTNGTCWNECL